MIYLLFFFFFRGGWKPILIISLKLYMTEIIETYFCVGLVRGEASTHSQEIASNFCLSSSGMHSFHCFDALLLIFPSQQIV